MAGQEIQEITFAEMGFDFMRAEAKEEVKARGAYKEDSIIVYGDTHRDEAIAEMKELAQLTPEEQTRIKSIYRGEAAIYAAQRLKSTFSPQTGEDTPQGENTQPIQLLRFTSISLQ